MFAQLTCKNGEDDSSEARNEFHDSGGMDVIDE